MQVKQHPRCDTQYVHDVTPTVRSLGRFFLPHCRIFVEPAELLTTCTQTAEPTSQNHRSRLASLHRPSAHFAIFGLMEAMYENCSAVMLRHIICKAALLLNAGVTFQ